ncbi:MAG: type I glyceraldehyde-3-phosphate dehydrogenase [Acidobacteria bacterium]|nr:type I glyceraldehyde-3-phosphate dehydrogenase [Acidobacteriota bacterium]
MSIKVGVNGFGRIGRNFFRYAFADPEIEVVAVNDLTNAETLAHLLKYDSILRTFDADVKAEGDSILVNGQPIKVYSVKDPMEIPWQDHDIEVVVEATGMFRKRDGAMKHLRDSVRKVIISAPATEPDVTLVLGVNDAEYDKGRHHIISNASCTTNCLAPVAKVLHDNWGIVRGFMTTIHSYTNDQRILDLPHKDLRRARAAAVNIIPTSTGAARAIGLVIPELAGRVDGISVRVPTPDVSLVDLVVEVSRTPTAGDINDAMKRAAEGELKGILAYSDVPLVSSDFIGDAHSSIFDAEYTKVIDNTVKVLAWYDNEWGYSCRVADLIKFIMK